MNKQQITTKQLALCSVLLTLMLVLGWVESLFPPLMGVPGIKLGLSNGVLIFAVYMLSLPTAWVLMLLKVVLSSLFLGGVAALPYALAGGVLSLASMCLLSRMKWMHPVTVSIVGGVMHNVGQIVMAMIILHTSQLAYYMAVLMLSGILFGALTGGFFGDFIPQLCRLINPASTFDLPAAPRASHARDDAPHPSPAGERATRLTGRPQTSSFFMPSCRLHRGEALCTTKIN